MMMIYIERLDASRSARFLAMRVDIVVARHTIGMRVNQRRKALKARHQHNNQEFRPRMKHAAHATKPVRTLQGERNRSPSAGAGINRGLIFSPARRFPRGFAPP